jgi:hypothetical protein
MDIHYLFLIFRSRLVFVDASRRNPGADINARMAGRLVKENPVQKYRRRALPF